MATGLTRLIRIYLHSNTSFIITYKIIKIITYKRVQVNLPRSQKIRSLQYQKAHFSNYQRKDEACRFNGKSILYEREESSRARRGGIKNKHGDRKKSWSQEHQRRGAQIWNDVNVKTGRFRP